MIKRTFALILMVGMGGLLWGQTFHYPAIPDSIENRQSRIIYMAEHFWDDCVVGDSSLFCHPKLLLDWIYLLRNIDMPKSQESIDIFISKFTNDDDAIGKALYWLDDLLHDSDSPYYDEELYLQVLESVLMSDVDSVVKIYPASRRELVTKNRIGTIASDFEFVKKNRESSKLSDINAPMILLFFNNPDCSICDEVKTKMVSSPVLYDFQNVGKLKVLAITPDAEKGEWQSKEYPSNWIVGYDENHIIYDKALYEIQRYPSFYLLDNQKCVLVKEANWERILKYLGTL